MKRPPKPSTPGPTRMVGYCRVSTEMQVDEGISLDAQRDKLEKYAAACDIDLVEIFTDAGVSAKTLDRPALQIALKALKSRRVDGLLVTKLDRLTRNVRNLGELVEDYFADSKWVLVSVGEQIDTRSAMGRLVLNLLGSVAQWEREAIGERVKDALAFLKSQGVVLGREALGWTRSEEVDGEGRRVLQENPKEAATVARILELHRDGLSLRKIAEVLRSERRPTKRGGEWQAQTVASVLARGVK